MEDTVIIFASVLTFVLGLVIGNYSTGRDCRKKTKELDYGIEETAKLKRQLEDRIAETKDAMSGAEKAAGNYLNLSMQVTEQLTAIMELDKRLDEREKTLDRREAELNDPLRIDMEYNKRP